MAEINSSPETVFVLTESSRAESVTRKEYRIRGAYFKTAVTKKFHNRISNINRLSKLQYRLNNRKLNE